MIKFRLSQARTRIFASCLFVLVIGTNCQSGTSAGNQDASVQPTDSHQPATTGRYIPLAVGATWTWNAYDSLTGNSGVTSSTVEASDTLTGAKAGISAFRIRSTTLAGSTINWQQDSGGSIVRHREQFLDTTGTLTSDHLFTPSKLRLDESSAHTSAQATWTETYVDNVTASSGPRVQPTTTITVTWTVLGVDESVTVPAGLFKCLHVHSVESGAKGYDSEFWYARNVGKVKESGTEVRELVGYTIP